MPDEPEMAGTTEPAYGDGQLNPISSDWGQLMEQAVIDSIDSYARTQRRLSHLLSKEGSERTAVALAEALVPGEGQEQNVSDLRACAYTDAGIKLKDPALVQEGVRLWCEMESHDSVTVSYNLASAKLNLWQLAVEQAGLGDAWLNERGHLHEARRLFNLVAQHREADTELRLKALSDCGNSFDIVGRYLDALDCYERALELDSTFGMAAGNRGITLLNLAPLMRGYQSHVLSRAYIDLNTAIRDHDRLLRCGGQSALATFKRQLAGFRNTGELRQNAAEPSPHLGDPHLNWCLCNKLFLHIWPDCIRAESIHLDAVTFGNFRLNLDDGPVLDRANEIIDAFNSIKQEYIAARFLVWLAVAEDSPIRGQAKTITRRISFWDTLKYAYWGARPGIAVQALKDTLDTLDSIAAFVHLYFRTGRGIRNVTFGTLPYTDRKKRSLAPPLDKALKQPEHNRGLAALFDLSAGLEEQSASHLRRLNQRRHAATHRFFSVHIEGTPDSSNWIERLSWSELIEESLESLRIARSAILFLAHMVHFHEKAGYMPDSPRAITMPLPFNLTEVDLIEPG